MVHRFKFGQGNAFLREIKIHSMPSFGDVKLDAHVVRFYGM
jgi:hypothetical protein